MRPSNYPGTNVRRGRLDEIAKEVLDLLDARDIFAHLAGEVKTEAMEARLQELLQTRVKYETLELAMYLRASFVASDRCPSWRPLLNAAVEQGKMRNDNVRDTFAGMWPDEPHPQPNVQR